MYGGTDPAVQARAASSPRRYRKPYHDSANIKHTDMKRKIWTIQQNDWLPDRPAKAMKFYFLSTHIFCFLILLPPHIALICLCLLTHKPTQKQSQKSAIVNAPSTTTQTAQTLNLYNRW